MKVEKIEPFVIRMNESIEAAMTNIELNGHRSLIVLDDNKVVVGTISDGDIRRALLNHRLSTIPVHQVMNTNFFALTKENQSEAESILKQGHITLIPIIDERGILLHILSTD